MNTLVQTEHLDVYHITPLHYLPLILSAGELLSKTQLRSNGFSDGHFRKSSFERDEDLGFGDYLHLTVKEWPPILKSKIESGFPHIRLIFSAKSIEPIYEICRYNIAKNRNPRGSKSPLPEGPLTGYYYGNLKVPVARTPRDQVALLKQSKKHMIEVLFKGRVSLKSLVAIECFSSRDKLAVIDIMQRLGENFSVIEKDLDYEYPVVDKHIKNVQHDISQFFSDENWKGRGLDFDILK